MNGLESVGAPSARGKLDLQVALSSHANLQDMLLCVNKHLSSKPVCNLHCFFPAGCCCWKEQQRRCRYAFLRRRECSTACRCAGHAG